MSNELSKKYNCNIITIFQNKSLAYRINNNIEIFNLYNKKVEKCIENKIFYCDNENTYCSNLDMVNLVVKSTSEGKINIILDLN